MIRDRKMENVIIRQWLFFEVAQQPTKATRKWKAPTAVMTIDNRGLRVALWVML